MAMMFWDASAIIPLCVEERYSEAMRQLLMEDGLISVWWGTFLECCSAFARLRRDRYIAIEEEQNAKEPLTELKNIWTEINPSETIREKAIRLISIHPLKAADSLQLSAAIIWAGDNPKGYQFVCLDNKLRNAAQNEGFLIIPEIYS